MKTLIDKLKKELDMLPIGSDISDLGNCIGFVIGLNSEKGWEKDNFISGMDHGFSLADGSHDIKIKMEELKNLEQKSSENTKMEQKNVLWGEREKKEKKEKVSVLIGLSRSPSFKPISDMEVGEYEYWLRTNDDLFELVPKLALELSNFFNQKKFGSEEITFLDFQQFGFKVEHYDNDYCKFMKRTNECEISGKFYLLEFLYHYP
jgi:hypothetical protein